MMAHVAHSINKLTIATRRSIKGRARPRRVVLMITKRGGHTFKEASLLSPPVDPLAKMTVVLFMYLHTAGRAHHVE